MNAVAPTISDRGWRVVAVALSVALLAQPGQAESRSHGTPASGSLEGGVSLPASGEGFVTYSRLGNWTGRQYVHSRVLDALLATFSALHAAGRGRIFVVGETGWKSGGSFRPHRTHQNGLSVDIFMPVVDGTGRSVPMPTPPWRKFGYGLEFDAAGQGDGLAIDFASLARLISELGRQGRRRGLEIERIIVAPEYVDRVLAAGRGELAPLSGRFQRRPAWVRHDEHVHLDFRLARRPAAGSDR